MKSIRVRKCGGPEVLEVVEIPDPVPGPGEVLIRIRAAGVNPVDTYIRSGSQGYSPALPYTPGFDGAGTVAAAGPPSEQDPEGGGRRIKADDRVLCIGSLTGTYAELAVCKLEQVYPLPRILTYAQGASIGTPYTTAYHALFSRAHAKPGDTILVHGAAGGVGSAAVQMAAAGGMRVIGSAGTPEGENLILGFGAADVVNHHDPNHYTRIMEMTGGRGVDVILEMLADRNLGEDLPILAVGGRVVVIGSRGEVRITPRDLMRRNAAILGMVSSFTTQGQKDAFSRYLQAGLENGSLAPCVGRELPLEQAPEAHARIIEGPAYGKIVLIP